MLPPMRARVYNVLNKCPKVILTSPFLLKICHLLLKRISGTIFFFQVVFLKDLFHKEIEEKFK